MISLDTNSKERNASIKVIGIGGGGGNAINNMIEKDLRGVEFIAANTDNQALEHNLASIKIQLGKQLTKGLGAGADPEIGKDSVEESFEELREALEGSDMVFLTAGMGGGTGTGGAPEIARIAAECDALTVGIVTKPFLWEGKRRLHVAEKWIEELRNKVDALIVIPNQRLLEIIDKKTSFKEAFLKVDEVLYNATRGISDIISQHGIVNVDFADVKTVMKGMGDALMGIGIAEGDNRAAEATQKAVKSPLLDGISIEGAKGILVNVTGGSDLAMYEIAEAVSIIEEAAGSNANIIHGVVYKEEMEGQLMVTVVATGFNKKHSGSEESQSNRFDIKPKTEEKAATSYEFDRSPKGVNQLKKFETPAYERYESRGKSGSKLGEQMEDRKKQLQDEKQQDKEKEKQKTNSDVVGKIKENNYENYDQPAFLRKIMD